MCASKDEGENSSCKANKKMRSAPSRIMSLVTFVNQTERSVDVVWLNHEGQQYRLKTLAPSKRFDVNTFVGHPWLFRDSNTGDKLVVEFDEVFQPPVPEHREPQRRKVINITIPVYSLKERSMQVVRKTFSRRSIPQLEIPQSLKQELLGTVS